VTVFFCDASDYDWGRGNVDVTAMAADGIVGLTAKATESTNVRHIHLADALNRGRAAGIPVLGAYHVVRSAPNVQAQVDYFLGYLDSAVPWWRDWPGFILQVDLEKWPYDPVTIVDGDGPIAARHGLPRMSEDRTIIAAGTGAGFTAALRAAAPRNAYVVVYASKGQYGDALTGIGVPLWNANYPSSRNAPYRDMYPGDAGPGWVTYSGQMPIFWQYASTATIDGQPTCDINAFRGTRADLINLVTKGAADMSQDFANLGPPVNVPTWMTGDIAAVDLAALFHYRKTAWQKSGANDADGWWIIQQVAGIRSDSKALADKVDALQTDLDLLQQGGIDYDQIERRFTAALRAALAEVLPEVLDRTHLHVDPPPTA
jgi:hypothetical protein